ncbi:MAG: hypothetical protein IKK70_01670 [Clostridia bacterium]|nr:hypothetical protein [Clostridia bacterium]
MAENNRWNKKIFAMLLTEAKGVRSWRQFAADCDISYVQMRKLALGTQENPPRPKLIRKVALHAFGEIDLEDLMFAAGNHTGDSMAFRESSKLPATPIDKYRSLPSKERKTVDKFIEFLLEEVKKGNSLP